MNAVATEIAAPWLESLNAEQRQAVCHGRVVSGRFESAPLLIIAGAGTGKTNTLAYRVAHLLLNGVAPEQILLLTFSRRAAQELQRRAESIVTRVRAQQDGRQLHAGRFLWAGTFHSVANRLLRKYAANLGLDASFSVTDRGDAADVLDIARQECGFHRQHKRFPRKDTCIAIYSHSVNTQRPLAVTLQTMFPWCLEWESELKQLFRAYVEHKQLQQTLDYDDLLLYWHALVEVPTLASEISANFTHILVDEYQDTNVLQAQILMALRPSGAGVCVVGDDAQAIYSFRAANVENILEFPQAFTPPARIIALEHNYRSVQPILDSANALMRDGTRQYQKALRSSKASAERPNYVTVEDGRAQVDYVIERILGAREAGVPLRHQAVLMRNGHHSDELELELVRRNIPYVKYGGLKFLEAAHVKDLLAVLRWADNPRNRVAGFRALQLLPGIGPGHADRCLKVFAASGYDWRTLIDYQVPGAARADWQATITLVSELSVSPEWIGQVARVREWYEPHLMRIYDSAQVRIGDLEQLERIAGQYATREQFVTELTLDPPQAVGDLSGPPLLDEDYLILSTIHSAKGQEWDSVYLLNVADGNFPSEFSTGNARLVEEERRLLYVGMTRAKQSLHLIAPLKYYVTRQVQHGDKHVYGAKSRFISDSVLATLHTITWPPESARTATNTIVLPMPRVNVAERLKKMWD